MTGSERRGEIEAREIVFVREDRRILDGASLRLAAGEIAALRGPSGCGKSTLLRIMATLVEPDGGTVLLNGVTAVSIPPRVFRTRVAYVPQQPPMFEGAVRDNVAMGPSLRGLTLSEAEICEQLDRVGLPRDFLVRDTRQLSGGERQRVALARALANGPEVLLLDEPTSALDPAASERILGLVRTLAQGGLSVVMVTHIEQHAEALGGTCYDCRDGRVFPAA